MNIDWKSVTRHAATIVNSYSTSVTLRQLFYRLVSDGTLRNTTNAYKGLSRHTAQARREGWFPALIDRGRTIHRYQTFTGVDQASRWLSRIYRRNRTEGQEQLVYLGVEKAGMVVQLQSWFGGMGVPILALGGYSSQTYVDDVMRDTMNDGRDAVLLYAGDFDPSGEDIDRDFLLRANCFSEVHRVGLTQEIVDEYNLPEMPGKITDSRASGFIDRHGKLVQVELDALDPADLEDLFQRSIDLYWDSSAYDDVMAVEQEETDKLIAFAAEQRNR